MGYGRLEGWIQEQADAAPDRIFLLPAVPPDELLEWTASADVTFVGQPPRTLNQKLNLPNKLFESLMAGVPVVVSEGNEQCRLVSEERVGRCCDVDSPAAIAETIASLLEAPADERHRAAGALPRRRADAVHLGRNAARADGALPRAGRSVAGSPTAVAAAAQQPVPDRLAGLEDGAHPDGSRLPRHGRRASCRRTSGSRRTGRLPRCPRRPSRIRSPGCRIHACPKVKAAGTAQRPTGTGTAARIRRTIVVHASAAASRPLATSASRSSGRVTSPRPSARSTCGRRKGSWRFRSPSSCGARHGGVAVYDSRDLDVQSARFARLPGAVAPPARAAGAALGAVASTP